MYKCWPHLRLYCAMLIELFVWSKLAITLIRGWNKTKKNKQTCNACMTPINIPSFAAQDRMAWGLFTPVYLFHNPWASFPTPCLHTMMFLYRGESCTGPCLPVAKGWDQPWMGSFIQGPPSRCMAHLYNMYTLNNNKTQTPIHFTLVSKPVLSNLWPPSCQTTI